MTVPTDPTMLACEEIALHMAALSGVSAHPTGPDMVDVKWPSDELETEHNVLLAVPADSDPRSERVDSGSVLQSSEIICVLEHQSADESDARAVVMGWADDLVAALYHNPSQGHVSPLNGLTLYVAAQPTAAYPTGCTFHNVTPGQIAPGAVDMVETNGFRFGAAMTFTVTFHRSPR